MGRPKKNKDLHSNVKPEVKMSEEKSEVMVMESIESELDQVRIELENTKREIETKKQELKALGRSVEGRDAQEQKVLDNQLHTMVKNDGLKDKIERQKAYDDVVITGRFMNRRHPGSTVKLTYMKYATDPVKWYTFEDGKVYDIKRGFADQINEHYYKPGFVQSQQQMDPNRPMSVISEVDTSEKLYAFVPVNF